MNKKLLIIFLSLLFFLLFCCSSNGFDNENTGHNSITNEGAKISGNGHIGNRDFDAWLFNQTTGALTYFLTGVHDEDCTKYGGKTDSDGNPIGDCRMRGPNSNLWGNFFEHFYNPMTGAGLTRLVKEGQHRTAVTRAKECEKHTTVSTR